MCFDFLLMQTFPTCEKFRVYIPIFFMLGRIQICVKTQISNQLWMSTGNDFLFISSHDFSASEFVLFFFSSFQCFHCQATLNSIYIMLSFTPLIHEFNFFFFFVHHSVSPFCYSMIEYHYYSFELDGFLFFGSFSPCFVLFCFVFNCRFSWSMTNVLTLWPSIVQTTFFNENSIQETKKRKISSLNFGRTK